MKEQQEEVWLTTQQGVALLEVNKSTIKRRIDGGKYVAKMVDDNGGTQYRILLSSLPESAQHKYHLEQARADAANMAENADKFRALDLLPDLVRNGHRVCG